MGSNLQLNFIILLLIQLIIGLSLTTKVDYTGHKVLTLHPKSKGDFLVIWNLSERDYLDLEIWGESVMNRTLDLRVPPHSFSYISRCLDHYGIHWTVEISDLQSLIDDQMSPRGRSRTRNKRSALSTKPKERKKGRRKWRNRRRRRQLRRLRMRRAFQGRYTVVGHYARYRQIRMWMKSLEKRHSGLAKVVEIGRTFENRALELLKISTSHGSNVTKPAIWLDAGLHGREWIAPATVVYVIEQLLSDQDSMTKQLVERFEWYLLPVANPDGYEYSQTVDRLWRKTRSRSAQRGSYRCDGVDLNRNFGFQWKGHCNQNWPFMCGSSDPCRHTYAGLHPFSEPESQAMAEMLYSHRDHIKMYLSLHSYSQLWLIPWGYTDHPPQDKLDLMHMARKGMNALKSKHGTRYVAGSPANILYAAGGGSYDWAKAVAGIKYSYTLELRDRGRYGFILPEKYIIPVGEETWIAIKTVAHELLAELNY